MKKIATISSKRQVTLPRQLSSGIKIMPREKVLMEESEEGLIIKPLKRSIVEELAGSLAPFIPPSKRGVPFDKIMEETKRIVAKKLATE